MPTPSDVLHVTNGDSTGKTLRRTSLGGDVLCWDDALYVGPVPAVGAEELRSVRADFLAACGWGDARSILHSLERRDRLLTGSLEEGRHVVLWFEHDLYDQLQLLQILALVAETGYDAARLELIVVGAFDGRPNFHGLGELTADELQTLWPLRGPVTEEIVEIGRLGWEALRAPVPMAVEALLVRETQVLPFLAAALRRLLEELPDVASGLSRSERQLVEALSAGPRRAAELFHASQEREEAPFDGDAWAWKRLTDLGAGRRPLVAVDGDGALPAPPPRGDARAFGAASFALTADGRDVLAGKADRIALAGIDRWLGGTHLRPGHVWRWDAARGRVVRSADLDDELGR